MNLSNALYASPRRRAGSGVPRFIPLMSCALLILAAFGSATYRAIEGGKQGYTPKITQGIARQRAEILCQKFTLQPAQTVALTGCQTPLTPLGKTNFEWQITCRSGANEYILCLDAETGKLRSLHREGDVPTHATTRQRDSEGGAVLPLSEATAIAQGKRYLIQAGCAAPPEGIVPESAYIVHRGNEWTQWRLCLAYRGTDGIRHRARLNIDAQDGGLEAIGNRQWAMGNGQ